LEVGGFTTGQKNQSPADPKLNNPKIIFDPPNRQPPTFEKK
jgi:hypothetical protein